MSGKSSVDFFPRNTYRTHKVYVVGNCWSNELYTDADGRLFQRETKTLRKVVLVYRTIFNLNLRVNARRDVRQEDLRRHADNATTRHHDDSSFLMRFFERLKECIHPIMNVFPTLSTILAIVIRAMQCVVLHVFSGHPQDLVVEFPVKRTERVLFKCGGNDDRFLRNVFLSCNDPRSIERTKKRRRGDC